MARPITAGAGFLRHPFTLSLWVTRLFASTVGRVLQAAALRPVFSAHWLKVAAAKRFIARRAFFVARAVNSSRINSYT
jgi:hypothetical protein